LSYAQACTGAESDADWDRPSNLAVIAAITSGPMSSVLAGVDGSLSLGASNPLASLLFALAVAASAFLFKASTRQRTAIQVGGLLVPFGLGSEHGTLYFAAYAVVLAAAGLFFRRTSLSRLAAMEACAGMAAFSQLDNQIVGPL